MRSTGIAALVGSCALLLVALFFIPGRSVAQLAAVVAAFASFLSGFFNWVLPRHYARRGRTPLSALVFLQFGWQDWLRLCAVAAGFFGLVLIGVSLGGAKQFIQAEAASRLGLIQALAVR
jgi:hypothetical protein